MTDMIHGSMSVPFEHDHQESWWRTVDRASLIAIFVLFLIGLLLSLSVSPTLAGKNNLDPYYYVFRQIQYGILSFALILFLSRLPVLWVRRLGVIGFFGAFVLLLLLPFFGESYGKGAIRWFSFGPISIQPSEFLKPGLAIFLAWLLAVSKEEYAPPGRLLAGFFAGICVLILALQPDFGQASLIIVAFMAMLFVSGFRYSWLFLWAILVMFAGRFAYTHSEHLAGRINSFLSGEIAPNTQIAYAANAISNGGFFGVGMGDGFVKYNLPDAHTDFIIAVAAEEFGIILPSIVMFSFAFVVYRSFTRLLRVGDWFTKLAGVGLVTLLGAQSMVNMGVAARVFPTKGMTLPFISYGGSSLLALGITVGFLLALTRDRPYDRYERF